MYVKKLTPEASRGHYFSTIFHLLKAQKKMCLIIKHIWKFIPSYIRHLPSAIIPQTSLFQYGYTKPGILSTMSGRLSTYSVIWLSTASGKEQKTINQKQEKTSRCCTCCSVAVRKRVMRKSKINSIFIYIYINIEVILGYGDSFRELQHCNTATNAL